MSNLKDIVEANESFKRNREGLHPDIIGFSEELLSYFPNAVFTSGKRPGAVTNFGKPSRHSKGEAVDLRITPEIGEFLSNDRKGIELLYKYQLGFLDESKAENKKWGNALHIGKDTALVEKTNSKWKEWQNKQEDTTPKYVSNGVIDFQKQPSMTGVNLGELAPEEDKTKEQKEIEESNKALELEDRKLKLFEQFNNRQIPQQQEEEVAQQAPDFNALETYQQIDQFVSNPLMQSGGVVNDNLRNNISNRDYTKDLEYERKRRVEQQQALQDYFSGKTSYVESPTLTQDKRTVEQRQKDQIKAQQVINTLNKKGGQEAVDRAKQIEQQLGEFTSEVLSTPQKVATLLTTGEYGTPSEVMGMPSGMGATIIDMGLDPLNFLAFKAVRGMKGDKFLNSNFKSEIDWGKWNKEIPNNKTLMKEYNAIEQQAKADGTWMKNPDGSAFKGTPEQFVQQNSENFKKAFPNPVLDDAGNIQTNYHGSPYKFEEFKPALKPTDKTGERLGSGIYTTPKRTKALEYAVKNQNKKGTLYELYQNANNKQTAIQDIDNYITTKIEKIKSDFLNKKISNQKANELYDAVLKENDELWDKIPDSEFKLQKGKDYLRIDDEQVVPFNNYPKSMIGNNGMFDMTNPNIYKALFPGAIGAGLMMNNKENRTPQNSFALGGELNKNINKLTQFNEGGQIPTSSLGQYQYPNQIVNVPTPNGSITMQGVDYPLLGVSQETGQRQVMFPGLEYFFKDTQNVVEVPLDFLRPKIK